MKTNTKKYNSNLKAYMLPLIEQLADGYKAPQQPQKPYSWLAQVALDELVPHYRHYNYNRQAILADWLQGGRLALPIFHGDILELSERLAETKFDSKTAERVIDNFYSLMAAKILQFAAKEK